MARSCHRTLFRNDYKSHQGLKFRNFLLSFYISFFISFQKRLGADFAILLIFWPSHCLYLNFTRRLTRLYLVRILTKCSLLVSVLCRKHVFLAVLNSVFDSRH